MRCSELLGGVWLTSLQTLVRSSDDMLLQMAEQEDMIKVLREQITALQGENCNLSKENAKLLQTMMQVGPAL